MVRAARGDPRWRLSLDSHSLPLSTLFQPSHDVHIMASDYRILVLGDEGSSKTSLITAYLKEGPVGAPSPTSTSSDLAAAAPSSSSERPTLPVVSFPGIYGGTLYIVDAPSECEVGSW